MTFFVVAVLVIVVVGLVFLVVFVVVVVVVVVVVAAVAVDVVFVFVVVLSVEIRCLWWLRLSTRRGVAAAPALEWPMVQPARVGPKMHESIESV